MRITLLRELQKDEGRYTALRTNVTNNNWDSFRTFKKNGLKFYKQSEKTLSMDINDRKNLLKQSINEYDKAFDILCQSKKVSENKAIDWLYKSEYEILLSRVKRCFVDFLIEFDVETLKDGDPKNLIKSTKTAYQHHPINAGILLAEHFLEERPMNDEIVSKFGDWCTENPHCDFSSSSGGNSDKALCAAEAIRAEAISKGQALPITIKVQQPAAVVQQPARKQPAAVVQQPARKQAVAERVPARGGKKRKSNKKKSLSNRKKLIIKKVGVYKTKSGYFYRRYKNGKVKRISKETYKKSKNK